MTNWNGANRIGILLIGAVLSLTLWSCASGPAPIDHYYQIDAGVPDAPATRKLEGILQVDRLRTDALTRERQLLYREAADAPEIRQHPYQRWSDPPAILLQTELISFLIAAAAADTVIPATARVKPDYVVSGRAKSGLRKTPRLRPRRLHLAKRYTSSSSDSWQTWAAVPNSEARVAPNKWKRLTSEPLEGGAACTRLRGEGGGPACSVNHSARWPPALVPQAPLFTN